MVNRFALFVFVSDFCAKADECVCYMAFFSRVWLGSRDPRYFSLIASISSGNARQFISGSWEPCRVLENNIRDFPTEHSELISSVLEEVGTWYFEYLNWSAHNSIKLVRYFFITFCSWPKLEALVWMVVLWDHITQKKELDHRVKFPRSGTMRCDIEAIRPDSRAQWTLKNFALLARHEADLLIEDRFRHHNRALHIASDTIPSQPARVIAAPKTTRIK